MHLKQPRAEPKDVRPSGRKGRRQSAEHVCNTRNSRARASHWSWRPSRRSTSHKQGARIHLGQTCSRRAGAQTRGVWEQALNLPPRARRSNEELGCLSLLSAGPCGHGPRLGPRLGPTRLWPHKPDLLSTRTVMQRSRPHDVPGGSWTPGGQPYEISARGLAGKSLANKQRVPAGDRRKMAFQPDGGG